MKFERKNWLNESNMLLPPLNTPASLWRWDKSIFRDKELKSIFNLE